MKISVAETAPTVLIFVAVAEAAKRGRLCNTEENLKLSNLSANCLSSHFFVFQKKVTTYYENLLKEKKGEHNFFIFE